MTVSHHKLPLPIVAAKSQDIQVGYDCRIIRRIARRPISIQVRDAKEKVAGTSQGFLCTDAKRDLGHGSGSLDDDGELPKAE